MRIALLVTYEDASQVDFTLWTVIRSDVELNLNLRCKTETSSTHNVNKIYSMLLHNSIHSHSTLFDTHCIYILCLLFVHQILYVYLNYRLLANSVCANNDIFNFYNFMLILNCS